MTRTALVAPDGFKGTLASDAVAAAVARGLRGGGVEADELPVADGGEGTLAALLAARGGELRTATVADPLGRPVEAGYGLLADGTGVVECARASGLSLVAEGERDAFAASTRGTGELIAAAVEAGAERVVVAVGDSATTDGGSGALRALDDAGVRPPRLEAWCDARIPWERAVPVFAAQKGADAETRRRLQDRLGRLARRAPRDPRGVPLTGAAGGLAGGLWAFLGAKLLPGAAAVLDAAGFDARMDAAALVVAGEGRLDRQTFLGKAAFEVATRARQGGVACHAVVGSCAIDAFEQRVLDLQTVVEATDLAELEAAGRALAAGLED